MGAVRKENVIAGSPVFRGYDRGTLLACPNCNREMTSQTAELPLHMNPQGQLCVASNSPGSPSKFGEQIREPYTRLDLDKLTVSEILGADTCLGCGGVKKYGATVCPGCYQKLPHYVTALFPEKIHGYLMHEPEREEFIKRLQAVLERLSQN